MDTSLMNPAGNNKDRGKRYTEGKRSLRSELGCQPLVILGAITCLIGVGFTKAPEINAFLKGIPLQAPVQTNVRHVSSPANSTSVSKPKRAAISTAAMARIKGLSASKSTITGFADAQSMTGGYYWTMTLKNVSASPQEAQMVIGLPAGTTISRATLWVNGVAQEAAFSTQSQVTAAYEWVKNGRYVAPRMSSDPLVITQESPGVIRVKAAPVLANGAGEMKLRLGFTAPLRVSGNKASLDMPYVHDANFKFDRLQDVHIESKTAITSSIKDVAGEANKQEYLLRGNIDVERLYELAVAVDRTGQDGTFATRATHSPVGTYIVADLRNLNGRGDGLALRKVHEKPNCKILDSEPAAHRLSTLWAYAQIESLASQQNPMANARANELAQAFRVISSVSGATVLERESDYQYMGLQRDMYTTLDYKGSEAAVAQGGGSGDGSVDYSMFDSTGPSVTNDAGSVTGALPRVKAAQAPRFMAAPGIQRPEAQGSIPKPMATRGPVPPSAPAPSMEQYSMPMAAPTPTPTPTPMPTMRSARKSDTRAREAESALSLPQLSSRLMTAHGRHVADSGYDEFNDTTDDAIMITDEIPVAKPVVSKPDSEMHAPETNAESTLFISQMIAWMLGTTFLLHGLIHRGTTVMFNESAGLDARSRFTIGAALIVGGLSLPAIVGWLALLF